MDRRTVEELAWAISKRVLTIQDDVWTPTLAAASGADPVYTTQVGTYTKQGNLVHVQGRLTTSSIGTLSGAAQISNLPFNASATTNNYSTATILALGGVAITAGQSIVGLVLTNDNSIALYLWDAANGVTPLQASEWAAAGDCVFSATYKV